MSILERALPIDSAPKLSPLNDYVYVRQDKIPDMAGRFFLPDQNRRHKATRYGTVLAVGPGRLVCYEYDGELYLNGTPNVELGVQVTTRGGQWWITKRLPLSVKPGDRVAFMDYAGEALISDTDPSLLIMKEEEILAVMS